MVKELSVLDSSSKIPVEMEFNENDLIDVDFSEFLELEDDEYDTVIIGMRNRILNDFSEEKDKLYRVKFNHYNEELDIEEDVYIVMTQGKLLTLIILAEPFQKYDVEFDSDNVMNIQNTGDINEYFDIIIKSFMSELNIDISKTLMVTISRLSILSSMVLGSYAVTINLYDLCHIMNTNKKFKELIDFDINKVKKNMGFKESNTLIEDKFNEFTDILKSNNNCYNVLMQNKVVNFRQLKDSLFQVGYKPDDKGYIIPQPVGSSYIRGNDIIGFYIDCVGGRKALVA